MSVTSPKAPRATAWKRKFIDSFQNDAAIEPVPLPRSATPPSPKGTTPANHQQALPLLKGSVSPKEKATSASKGTTLPKQRSSLAAGERLSFKVAPQAQPCRASAVTSASASSAAAVVLLTQGQAALLVPQGLFLPNLANSPHQAQASQV